MIPQLPVDLENPLDAIRNLYKRMAFFYDKNGIFWFWTGNRYEIVDETDLMISIERNLNARGKTCYSSHKSTFLNAFKMVGRENIPETISADWIQFKETLHNIKTGQVKNATPRYFCTNPLPYNPETEDHTPRMDVLFGEWVGKENVQTLVEIIAYCCYRDYPIHLAFALIGAGRNGKSRFLALLGKFLGNINVCASELDRILDSRFETFKLYKKLGAIMGETNFASISKTSIFKRLTGGDLIDYEKKGCDPFNDYSFCKIIIASNSLPISHDTSEGYYRRWLIINFPNEFQEGRDVLETIPDVEYNNLARRVLNTLPLLLKRGSFTGQGSVEERKTAYIEASNPLSLFIQERCFTYDPNSFISYGELFTAYTQYLHQHKRRKVKGREFTDALIDLGFEKVKTTKIVRGESVNGHFIFGLELKKVTEVTEVTENSYQPLYRSQSEKPVITVTSVTQPVKTQISFNDLVKKKVLFDVWLPCSVEGCNNMPCADFSNKLLCKRHQELGGGL